MSLSKLRLPVFRFVRACRLTSLTNNQLHMTSTINIIPHRGKSDDKSKDLSVIIQPIPVKPTQNTDDISVGAELTGSLIKKEDMLKLLNQFYRRSEIKLLSAQSGLDNRLFHQAYISFRRFCVESETLSVDLHIVFSDILQGAGHVDDVFPYFLRHAKEIFPHLDCMEDLKKICDLRLPANWYPEARAIQRKIIFHAGPTNSGKTYHALERFMNAKTGIYCGPLKLLASEVFQKSNNMGTPCDLVTGEERRYASSDGEPASHLANTVEMTSINTPYEVAVIDEIQMMKDQQRGWAWSRALLGVCAEEVHVCGEGAAIDLVKELMLDTGDEVEVRRYKRLTKLKFLKEPIESFDNIQRGDCIVCFSKNDIYYISRELEKRGVECAVLYGALPPGTKLAQAEKFNDPNDPCKVMVATDAIGMGLNLSINRIIFYSLWKPTINDKGEKEMDVISTSQALQIAGRAGRFGTEFETGHVTTFKKGDLQLLDEIIHCPIDVLEQAGLHPTAEQIELFAYHLPKATLSNLIDIFVTLCSLDNDKYFMCQVEDFKFLADIIEHVPLSLRVRYVFCCSPIPKQQPFVTTMFLKFARQFSRGEPLTLEWLCKQVGWPFSMPNTLAELVHLEGVFDVMDSYLWLSYRFQDMFPDHEHVRDMQRELDQIIQVGVRSITRLLKAQETPVSRGANDDESDFEIKNRIQNSPELESVLDPSAMKPKTLRDRFLNVQKAKKDENPHDSRVVKEFRPQFKHKINTGHGRLTEHLMKQGVLSPEMLKQLQKEWSQGSNDSSDDDSSKQ